MFAAKLLTEALISWLHNEYAEILDPSLKTLHDSLVVFHAEYF